MEQEQNKLTIPLAIVVAGALIAGAIFMGGDRSSSTENNEPTVSSVDVAEVTSADHLQGNPKAKLIIVEYSDTECPFCKVFHYTMKEVLNAYPNDVAWVFRHFPIPQLHAKAIKEAEATECAAELGGNSAFWRYLDKLFDTTQSNDSLDPAELPKIAVAIGLNENSFNECLSSGRHTATVTKSMEDAVKAGARGTPFSVILDSKGRQQAVINGAEPLDMVRSKIDALLK